MTLKTDELEEKKQKIFKWLKSYLLLYIFVFSCTWEGHRGVSSDIDESQNRNVFVCEYEPLTSTIKVNDTIYIDVEKAWLEKRWVYPRNPYNTLIGKGYQLIVEVKEVQLKGYAFTWTIGIEAERYFRICGENSILTDTDALPDSIETWKIQSGRALKEGAPHIIIGEFTLKRKR